MSDKEMELIKAAYKGRLDDVKRLVEKEGVNPNFDNGEALCYAAWKGRTTVVDYLLKKNVSTESRWCGGDTPLIDAARNNHFNHLEIVRLLLDANADLNAKDEDNKTALDWAVEYNYNDVAQLLRDHPKRKFLKDEILAALESTSTQALLIILQDPKIDVNLRDNNYTPLLHRLVDYGSVEVLECVARRNDLAINATDRADRTAFMLAVAKKDAAAVLVLLKAGACTRLVRDDGSIDCTDVFGNLLLEVVTDGDDIAVDLLLQDGVRPTATNAERRTALHLAVINANEAIVDQLLKKMESLAKYRDLEGNLPLHYAAAIDNSISNKLVALASENDLKATNNEGDTPLAVAVKKGCSRVVAALLSKEKTLGYNPREGGTLLHVAAASDRDCKDIIKALIAAGHNVFAKTTAGLTPLALARAQSAPRGNIKALEVAEAAAIQLLFDAVRDTDVAKIDVLVKSGVLVNAQDPGTGHTALHMAAVHRQDKVVAQLVAAGATVNNGQTALHAAVALPSSNAVNVVTVVKRLLLEGADVVAMDNKGRQPLHLAAMHGLVELLPLLVAANIDATDSDLMTPLHHAVKCGSIDVVKCLVAMGASLCLENKVGPKNIIQHDKKCGE
ncbi:hypothetical protein SDRG_12204 [Saprolegnia diclina VS20]|uniref:Uncharacterized protein n=1 Tax=Saprolegnia diclina (strain VS20) TaxID=1156394 RepID=T0Q6B1_SAPDV|nr:hypothetical protein SDRG_12204 [Saprolegnia diclina VS20]EQC30146.1 hypothetical protein SDRG_12204 [Saprolegnia diclina VS20]|eukprot:XP_008616489.1 hypothetical protein SDRG_12204 [Saprolegnia diclina VS20]